MVCRNCSEVAIKICTYQLSAHNNDESLKVHCGQTVSPRKSYNDALSAPDDSIYAVQSKKDIEYIDLLQSNSVSSSESFEVEPYLSLNKLTKMVAFKHPSIQNLYRQYEHIIVPRELYNTNISPTIPLDGEAVPNWYKDQLKRIQNKFKFITIKKVTTTTPSIVTNHLLSRSSIDYKEDFVSKNTENGYKETGRKKRPSHKHRETARKKTTWQPYLRRKDTSDDRDELIQKKRKSICDLHENNDSPINEVPFASATILPFSISTLPNLDEQNCENIVIAKKSVAVFICHFCSDISYSEMQLKQHEKTHIQCEFCKEIMPGPDMLHKHEANNCYTNIMRNLPNLKLTKVDCITSVFEKYPEAFENVMDTVDTDNTSNALIPNLQSIPPTEYITEVTITENLSDCDNEDKDLLYNGEVVNISDDSDTDIECIEVSNEHSNINSTSNLLPRNLSNSFQTHFNKNYVSNKLTKQLNRNNRSHKYISENAIIQKLLKKYYYSDIKNKLDVTVQTGAIFQQEIKCTPTNLILKDILSELQKYQIAIIFKLGSDLSAKYQEDAITSTPVFFCWANKETIEVKKISRTIDKMLSIVLPQTNTTLKNPDNNTPTDTSYKQNKLMQHQQNDHPQKQPLHPPLEGNIQKKKDPQNSRVIQINHNVTNVNKYLVVAPTMPQQVSGNSVNYLRKTPPPPYSEPILYPNNTSQQIQETFPAISQLISMVAPTRQNHNGVASTNLSDNSNITTFSQKSTPIESYQNGVIQNYNTSSQPQISLPIQYNSVPPQLHNNTPQNSNYIAQYQNGTSVNDNLSSQIHNLAQTPVAVESQRSGHINPSIQPLQNMVQNISHPPQYMQTTVQNIPSSQLGNSVISSPNCNVSYQNEIAQNSQNRTFQNTPNVGNYNYTSQLQSCVTSDPNNSMYWTSNVTQNQWQNSAAHKQWSNNRVQNNNFSVQYQNTTPQMSYSSVHRQNAMRHNLNYPQYPSKQKQNGFQTNTNNNSAPRVQSQGLQTERHRLSVQQPQEVIQNSGYINDNYAPPVQPHGLQTERHRLSVQQPQVVMQNSGYITNNYTPPVQSQSLQTERHRFPAQQPQKLMQNSSLSPRQQFVRVKPMWKLNNQI